MNIKKLVRSDGLFAWALLAPACVTMLGTSFRSYDNMYTTRTIFPDKLSLDFYKRVLGDVRVLNYFKNSFVTAVVTAVTTVIMAVFGGYAMARFARKVRGIKYFILFILAVQMFPTLQMIIPLYLTFTELGVMNEWYTLMLAYPAFTLPMSLMLMQSFIEGVPEEIEEAGRIDGCNRMQVLLGVVLPLCRPGIATAMILAFNHCWNEFLIAMLLIKNDDYRTMPIGLHNYMQENSSDWGAIMAAATLMIIPILLFLNVLQKHIVGGLTILGFGGSFTETSAYNYAKLDGAGKKKVIEAYFDTEKGLGYSFCRTHIHSCDFSLDEYAYTEDGDAEPKTFSIDRDRTYIVEAI